MRNIILLLFFTVMFDGVFAQTNDKYLVIEKIANVRSGPGKEYKILFVLGLNDQVNLLEKYSNGWYKIDYMGFEGYVYSKLLRKDPYGNWDRREYESGQTPDCTNISPTYDDEIDNYLKINVGSHTDAVVKLMQKNQYGEDKCIRIVYIRSNESYTMKNIPEGIYYLKIAYGKDWRQTVLSGQCYGKFTQNAEYSLGKDILDYNMKKIYDRIQIPSFELTIDMIITEKRGGKDFKSSGISESEFNK